MILFNFSADRPIENPEANDEAASMIRVVAVVVTRLLARLFENG